MSSIAITAFQYTIGLLVSKGIDKVAETLKDGDVTDQKFHSLIVNKSDEIKSKLDALSRKDLEASISFFEEGIASLYELFEIANARGECGAVTAPAAASNEAFLLIEGIKRLELTGLDESALGKLSTAKKRFKDARRKATEAFKNEALKTSDRILAMKYRVMATILEVVDNPANALAPCRVCLKELNSLPAVQNNFHVQLKKGIQAVKGLLSKEERREVISSVCHVNRVIYDVTRTFSGDTHLWTWPPVDTGYNKFNPLYDARVTKVLLQQGMEHCCVTPSSFGREGEKEHELKSPISIATNSSGEFIVGDDKDRCLKVFDRNGKLVKVFGLPTEDVITPLCIEDVVTDMNDNIFVLTMMGKPGFHESERSERSWWVYKPNKIADLHHRFRLRGERWHRRLSVRDTGKVMTLGDGTAVEEYDSNGEFVRSFGEEILRYAVDITVANDGRILVLDNDDPSRSDTLKADLVVHIFSEHGDYLNKFKLKRSFFKYTSITFQPAGEHVVVAGIDLNRNLLEVKILSKDGEFVRSVQIQNCDEFFEVRGIAMNNDGRIAAVTTNLKNGKVVVL